MKRWESSGSITRADREVIALAENFEKQREEIGMHQDYSVRVAMYTVGLVVFLLGMCAPSKESSSLAVGGPAIGALLIASVLFQNGAARKIYWMAAFLRERSTQGGDDAEWEAAWFRMRTIYRWSVGFWANTRVMAYCYILVCLAALYVCWSHLPSRVLVFAALALCLSLWWVPCINYSGKWRNVLVGSEEHRSDTEPASRAPKSRRREPAGGRSASPRG